MLYFVNSDFVPFNCSDNFILWMFIITLGPNQMVLNLVLICMECFMHANQKEG